MDSHWIEHITTFGIGRSLLVPFGRSPCVTPSVTIGSERDAQDATGCSSIRTRYLALRAEFRRRIANSEQSPICFSRPLRQLGWINLGLSPGLLRGPHGTKTERHGTSELGINCHSTTASS